MSQYIQLIPLPACGTQMLSCRPAPYSSAQRGFSASGHLSRPAREAAATPLVKIFALILPQLFPLAAERSMSTLYPLDRRGPYLALFAAAFTVLLLHFSPIATFDALGPSILRPLCELFFFLSLPISVSPPSRLSVFLLSLFLAPCLFPPLAVCGSEAAGCMGIGPHTSCPPPL